MLSNTNSNISSYFDIHQYVYLPEGEYDIEKHDFNCFLGRGFVSFEVSPPSAHHIIFSPVKNTKKIVIFF